MTLQRGNDLIGRDVLLTQTQQAARSSVPPFSVNTATSSIDLPELYIPSLLDVAVREYSAWQQSRLSDETLKAEVRKACDIALDYGLDLV
ncbi:hypothetical protein N7471_006852 [Penicillium samsonianum]|uniref:uncharacterized protein n=1 Tax=Penicillium samsonianum TaxID=1882272 RepID=UPI002547FCDF|nr:uncharacterized protein N7471_006852 [Penicillium samsonianum]KAJ6140366.1 hypothetical protein N7471_006852 [Penicillium samsonianum]